MKGTKVFGFITVLVFLGIPATVSGESLEECLSDYNDTAAQITNINMNDYCDITKAYVRCVYGYYRNEGLAWTSSELSKLEEKIEQSLREANIQCDESAEEMIEAAGFRNSSQRFWEVYRKCQDVYFNAAARITNLNQICDILKSYIRCFYGNEGLALTSSELSEVEEEIERYLREANIQCDESAEDMIRTSGLGNGSIKMSGTLSGLTLTFFAVVMSALVGTLY